MVQDQLWTSVNYMCHSVDVPPVLDDCDVYAFYRAIRNISAAKMVGIAKL